MADEKSREVIDESLTENQADGISQYNTVGDPQIGLTVGEDVAPLTVGDTPDDAVCPVKWTPDDVDKSREDIGKLSVKIDVNVEDALRGLKAVQRESRKAAQALREVESSYYETEGKRHYITWEYDKQGYVTNVKEPSISEIPTDILRRELLKREARQMGDVTERSTSEVAEELTRRTGVEAFEIAPYETLRYRRESEQEGEEWRTITGPARILINRD